MQRVPAARDNEAIRDLDHRARESLRDFAAAEAADKATSESQAEKPRDSGGVAVGNAESLTKVADGAFKRCAVM